MKSHRQGGRCPAARARAHAPVLPIEERTVLSCPAPAPLRLAAARHQWADRIRRALAEKGGADAR